MRTTVMFLLLLVAPTITFAKESVALSPINFQINADNALSKFEQTLNSPERLLKRFQPVGAKISKKQVSHNAISFVATKTVLFISKSVYVNGVLDSNVDDRVCSTKGAIGYRLTMRFDGSDALLSNNVEEIEATICLRSQSEKTIIGNAQSKVILGDNYSKALGSIAVDLIKDQVPALLSALTEEIKSLR